MFSAPYSRMLKFFNTSQLLSAVLLLLSFLILLELGVTCEAFDVTDDFVHVGQTYTGNGTIYYRLDGLNNLRKQRTTLTITDGDVRTTLVVEGKQRGAPDTFATAVDMKLYRMHMQGLTSVISLRTFPPSSYAHLQRITADHDWVSITLKPDWEYNTTVFIEDSDLKHTGIGANDAIRIYETYDGTRQQLAEHCILHVKKIKVIDAYQLLHIRNSDFLIQQHSALFLEDIVCLRCSYVLYLGSLSVADHSALIVKDVLNYNDQLNKAEFFYAPRSITVDESSLLSFMDVDTANNFSKPSSAAFKTQISGGGTVVISRLLMQRSGFTNSSLQPANNTKFWVSARASADTNLTPQQLRDDHNFNVNFDNTYGWSGTGADGTTCVDVGGGLPGQATYVMVDGKCTATCKAGLVSPACTEPAADQCLVDNCELCYRVTKTKCLLCAPHTNPESDTVCRCPVSHCRLCDSADTCSVCEDGYKLASNGSTCIPCGVTKPNCVDCSDAGQCTQCAPRYNLTALGSNNNNNNNKRCVRCFLDHCVLCSADDDCMQCAEGYTKPENSTGDCVSCEVTGCKRCDIANTCAVCSDKHTLSDDGAYCYACSTVPGCLRCSDDEQCAACADGYTFHEGQCLSCVIDGCQFCHEDGLCALCETNFTVSLNASACVPCNITNCISCTSADVCGMCECGMVPSEKGDACVPCVASHCKYCDPLSGDGKECADCAEGYALSGTTCKKVLMPPWAHPLVAMAGTVLVAGVAAVCVWYYFKYQEGKLQALRDAEARRYKRQADAMGGNNNRQRALITALDLSEIECAASGIRDDTIYCKKPRE